MLPAGSTKGFKGKGAARPADNGRRRAVRAERPGVLRHVGVAALRPVVASPSSIVERRAVYTVNADHERSARQVDQRQLAGCVHLADGVGTANTRRCESTRYRLSTYARSPHNLPPSKICAHQLVAQRALRVRGLACASERASPNASAVGLAPQRPRGRQLCNKIDCGARAAEHRTGRAHVLDQAVT